MKKAMLIGIVLIVFVTLVVSLSRSNSLNLFDLFHSSISSKQWSEWRGLSGENEYVIAKLKSAETFHRHEFNEFLGFPLGNTEAKLTVDVFYKYFIKPSEMQFEADRDNLTVTVKALYLQKPVATDNAKWEIEKHWFGPREDKHLNALTKTLQKELVSSGQRQISSARGMASSSLAENIKEFVRSQKRLTYNYKTIKIEFQDDRSGMARVFATEKLEPALLDFKETPLPDNRLNQNH